MHGDAIEFDAQRPPAGRQVGAAEAEHDADRARRYGAEVLEFPGMGHDVMLDRGWDRVLEAVLAFAADLPDRQSGSGLAAGAR